MAEPLSADEMIADALDVDSYQATRQRNQDAALEALRMVLADEGTPEYAFTERVRQLMEAGKTAEAQRLILDRLTGQHGTD